MADAAHKNIWRCVIDPFPIFSSRSLIPPRKYTRMEKRKLIQRNRMRNGRFSIKLPKPGTYPGNSRNRLTRTSTLSHYDLSQQNQIFQPSFFHLPPSTSRLRPLPPQIFPKRCEPFHPIPLWHGHHQFRQHDLHFHLLPQPLHRLPPPR